MKNQKPINIIYISEHNFKRLLIPKGLPDFDIHPIETAENYNKIKGQLKNSKPDLLLLDFEFMPGKINSLVRKIVKNHPECKLLVMGVFNSGEFAKTLIENGASGYFDHHCRDGIKGLADTIRKIYEGETVIISSPHSLPSLKK